MSTPISNNDIISASASMTITAPFSATGIAPAASNPISSTTSHIKTDKEHEHVLSATDDFTTSATGILTANRRTVALQPHSLDFGILHNQKTGLGLPLTIVKEIIYFSDPGLVIHLHHTSKSLRYIVKTEPRLQDRLRAFLANPDNPMTIPDGVSIDNGRVLNLSELQRSYLNSDIVKNKIRSGTLTFDEALAETLPRKINLFTQAQRQAIRKGLSPEQARYDWINEDRLAAYDVIVGEKVKALPESEKQENGALPVEKLATIHQETYEIVRFLTPAQVTGIKAGYPWVQVRRIPAFTSEHGEALKKGHKPEDISNLTANKLLGLVAGLSKAQVLSSPHFAQDHLDALKKNISFDEIRDLTELQVKGIIAGFSRKHVTENTEFNTKHLEAIASGFRPTEIGDLSVNELALLRMGVERKELLDNKAKVEIFHVEAIQNGKLYSEIRGLNRQQVEAILDFHLTREQVTLDCNKKPYQFGRKHYDTLKKYGKNSLEFIRGLTEAQVFLMEKYKLSRDQALTYVSSDHYAYNSYDNTLLNSHISDKHIAFYRKHQGKFDLGTLETLDDDGLLALEFGFSRAEINQLKMRSLLSHVVTTISDCANKEPIIKTMQNLLKPNLTLFIQWNEIELIILGFNEEHILSNRANHFTNAQFLAHIRKKATNSDYKSMQIYCQKVFELHLRQIYVSVVDLEALDIGMSVEQILEYKKVAGIFLKPDDMLKPFKMGITPEQLIKREFNLSHLEFLDKHAPKDDNKKLQEMVNQISSLHSPLVMEAVVEGLISRDLALKLKEQNVYLSQKHLELLRKHKDVSLEGILKLGEQDLENLFDLLEKDLHFVDIMKLSSYQKVAILLRDLTIEQVTQAWFTPQHAQALFSIDYDTIKELNGTQLAGIMQGLTREQVLQPWFSKRHLDALADGIAYSVIQGKKPDEVDKIWNEYIETRIKTASIATVTAASVNSAAVSPSPILAPMYAMAGASTSAVNELPNKTASLNVINK